MVGRRSSSAPIRHRGDILRPDHEMCKQQPVLNREKTQSLLSINACENISKISRHYGVQVPEQIETVFKGKCRDPGAGATVPLVLHREFAIVSR
jgi:hypothetical protein